MTKEILLNEIKEKTSICDFDFITIKQKLQFPIVIKCKAIEISLNGYSYTIKCYNVIKDKFSDLVATLGMLFSMECIITLHKRDI